MTTAPHTYLLPLAVIDEASGKICIWHIDVGPDVGLSRLSGAWVLEPDDSDTIVNLIRGRHVVLSNDTDILTRENITTAGKVDIDATVDAVIAERDALQARFNSHAATRKTLVPPTWPEIVHPKQIAAAVPRTENIIEQTGDSFPLARGLNVLAQAWTQLEKQRLARPFLIEPVGPNPRPLPLVLR
ncbi:MULTISPECIES: hypothetical protein [Rhodococcus]|uniref:Uncharacterized protein n=1 Tax=Rhodococcus qingshengii JCM 15477 TaxID=1303681 RepID=A0AB38RNJ1_RHOSG|nr:MULTISPECIES: hypothetical protein [Rhodococcus]MDA3637532.1 hypothetical protein [Rhodococcus sp. C-2]UPU46654.1 hypothetical protein M0639_31065 [Rhodococcus qingshengii JCM 15477]